MIKVRIKFKDGESKTLPYVYEERMKMDSIQTFISRLNSYQKSMFFVIFCVVKNRFIPGYLDRQLLRLEEEKQRLDEQIKVIDDLLAQLNTSDD